MLTILVAVAVYLATLAAVLVGVHALAQWNGRRYRLEVGRRMAAAARPRPPVETLFRANPAGPAQDALRSAQLRLMLDKTEPRA